MIYHQSVISFAFCCTRQWVSWGLCFSRSILLGLSVWLRPSERFTMPSTPMTLSYTSPSALTAPSPPLTTAFSRFIAGLTPTVSAWTQTNLKRLSLVPKTKVRSTNRWRHSRRRYSCHHKNSDELARCDCRQHAVIWLYARQHNFISGIYTPYPPVCDS